MSAIDVQERDDRVGVTRHRPSSRIALSAVPVRQRHEVRGALKDHSRLWEGTR